MKQTTDAVRHVLERTLAPLVRADGGRLFLVRADRACVAVHLHGSFAGCPGNSLVIRWVIKPALRAVAPHAQIEVTSGELIPEGAQPVQGSASSHCNPLPGQAT